MIAIFKKTPQIQFLRLTKYFVTATLILICIGLASLYFQGLKFGIDFRGGTEALLKVANSTKDQVRVALLDKIGGELSIIDVPSQGPGTFLVSFGQDALLAKDNLGDQITAALQSSGISFELLRLDTIGARVGSEIKTNAWYTLLISFGLILLYMAFRFSLSFGAGAVVALVHDAVLAVGAFSLSGIEFNLAGLAGILTLLGYSLNDTIVVFDRVRENLRKHPSLGLVELIDLSINETLGRTILTAGSTFLVILAMFIWGGDSILGFSFTFLIGILVGTYSSVFIASPVAILVDRLLPSTKVVTTS